MRNSFILSLLVVLAIGLGSVSAGDTKAGSSFEHYAMGYFKTKAAAYAAVWGNVKKAAEEQDFETAQKWGDLIHKWENDFHPKYVIK